MISVCGNIIGQGKGRVVYKSGMLTVPYFWIEINKFNEFGTLPLCFEEKLKITEMKYLPNKQFTFSEHALDYYLDFPCCDNKSCKLRDELMAYAAKFAHKDGKCEIFVRAISEESIRYYGEIKTTNKGPALWSYQHVSGYDFNFKGTEQDIEKLELQSDIHNYPQDSARMIFNADYMFRYHPDFYMKGNVHGNDFTHTIAVVTGRKGLDIFAYFLLTDESVKDFNKYLSDFKNTLWFNNE